MDSLFSLSVLRHSPVKLHCGSVSTIKVLCPISANFQPRWNAVVVLLTPPLLLKSEIVFAIIKSPLHLNLFSPLIAAFFLVMSFFINTTAGSRPVDFPFKVFVL